MSYPVGRFCFERRFAAGASMFFAGVWLVFMLQALTRLWAGDASADAMWALAMLLGVCGAFFFVWMLRQEQRVPNGELAWTQKEGDALWEWTNGQVCNTVQPRIRLDLGSAVWLSWTDHDDRAIWVWAQAAHDPSQWKPFRRALYAAV